MNESLTPPPQSISGITTAWSGEREHYHNTAPAPAAWCLLPFSIHCLWFHAGCLHSSDPNQTAFQLRLLGHESLTIDEYKEKIHNNDDVFRIIVVFAPVNDILQHFRTHLKRGRNEFLVWGLSNDGLNKWDHSVAVISLKIRWEFVSYSGNKSV